MGDMLQFVRRLLEHIILPHHEPGNFFVRSGPNVNGIFGMEYLLVDRVKLPDVYSYFYGLGH